MVGSAKADPEDSERLDRYMTSPRARWSMASSRARTGPSYVVRMLFVVPSASAERVAGLLAALVDAVYSGKIKG